MYKLYITLIYEDIYENVYEAFPFDLYCHSCGGGVSGTGGITADLDSTKKVNSLDGNEKTTLCRNIVETTSKITKSTESDYLDLAFFIVYIKYVNESVTLNEPPILKETFQAETPQSIETQCNENLIRVRELGQEETCSDSRESFSLEGQIQGPCDLDDPYFTDYNVSLDDFATCVEKSNQLIFRGYSGLHVINSCREAYDAISKKALSGQNGSEDHAAEYEAKLMQFEKDCGNIAPFYRTEGKVEVYPYACKALSYFPENIEDAGTLKPLVVSESIVPF